jgi:hypothetical protein
MSLLSFVLGWTTTSLTSGGGGATQASVSELTSRVAGIEAYLRQLPIATPQVATKPKVEVGPKTSVKPTPKNTSQPNTKSSKSTSKTTTPKAVRGAECIKGQTDSKFVCVEEPTTHKYSWADDKNHQINNPGKSNGDSANTSADTGTATK